MPSVAGRGGDNEAAGDEIKVFKDEGEDEQEVADLHEDLHAELLEDSDLPGPSGLRRPEPGHPFSFPGLANPWGMGYFMNPYAAAYSEAMGRGAGPPLSLPPPAHMGGLRPPLYPYSPLSMGQLGWGRSPYHLPLPPGSPHMSMPSLLPPHHLPFGAPGHHQVKPEYGDRPDPYSRLHDPYSTVPVQNRDTESPKKKEPHIKKPLNAFMLYMKEMRPVVQAECTLKESAAINQILGRRVGHIVLSLLFF